MCLGGRHIVAVNAASEIDIVPEVCVAERLAGVTLHRGNIVPVDPSSVIDIA